VGELRVGCGLLQRFFEEENRIQGTKRDGGLKNERNASQPAMRFNQGFCYSWFVQGFPASF
jgi:hypothetical protein